MFWSCLLIICILCLAMILPYLPGRFDASAATLSVLAQVAAYASVLLVPIGTAWVIRRRSAWVCSRLALITVGIIGLVIVLVAAAFHQLALGVILSAIVTVYASWVHGRIRPIAREASSFDHIAPCLVAVPIVLIAFRTAAVPQAAQWSRDRAIRHSAPLIAEIEAFRTRRGFYPISLQSLHGDVPTGVVGLERFYYEPNGEAYNLYFVRPHIQIDAIEVVMFNSLGEHRFASHELDLLQYDGAELGLRRGDRRQTPLPDPQWVSILLD